MSSFCPIGTQYLPVSKKFCVGSVWGMVRIYIWVFFCADDRSVWECWKSRCPCQYLSASDLLPDVVFWNAKQSDIQASSETQRESNGNCDVIVAVYSGIIIGSVCESVDTAKGDPVDINDTSPRWGLSCEA